MRDSPIKAGLKKDNAKLESALVAERLKTLETEQEANNLIAANNIMMAEKSQRALEEQKMSFEQAAENFKSEARCVVQQEMNASDRDTRAILENVVRNLDIPRSDTRN